MITKGEPESRVLNDSELKTLFDEIRDNRFNLFVYFAYYTGARSGEIRSISRKNVFSYHVVACSKSDKRLIKLNNQNQEISSGLDELWDYTKDFVLHKCAALPLLFCCKYHAFLCFFMHI